MEFVQKNPSIDTITRRHTGFMARIIVKIITCAKKSYPTVFYVMK